MSALVVDTHAIVWYLAGDPRLSGKAEAALEIRQLLKAKRFTFLLSD